MVQPVDDVKQSHDVSTREKHVESSAASSSGKPAVENIETVSVNDDYIGYRDESIKGNFRFVWVTLLVGCGLLEYGFDKGIVGSFQAMVGFLKIFGYEDPNIPSGWNIAAVPQQIISSFMLLGAFITSFATGPLGSFFSRRWCIFFGLILLVISITIMIVTTDLGPLYLSRLVMGFGNGIVMTFTMVYISELAPAKLRGLSYGFMTTWITAGTAVGLLIANATHHFENKLCYQIPLYTLYVMPAVLTISLPFLPESPRWLLLRGKDDEAMKALRWIRNGAYDQLALQSEFEEMRLNAVHDLESEGKWLIMDLFRGTNLRRTFLCCGVGLVNAGIGAMFVLAFGTYFFNVVGVKDPFKWIVVTQWLGVVGLLCAYYFLGKWGRRTMLLTGTSLCGISMLFLGVIFSIPSIHGTRAVSYGVIFLTSWFQFWFNFGVAPTTYLVAGELPAQNMRAYSTGLSTGIGYVFGWLTTFTAPYFINPAVLGWGGKYGYIWFGTTFIVVAFIYVMVPEVQGRSLEEIEEMFDIRLPAKDFPGYVSQNGINARAKAERELFEGKKADVDYTEAVTRV